MELKNLGTTGVLARAATQPNSTGRELGRIASSLLPSENASASRDWLLAQPTVRAADEALCRSLTSTLSVTPQIENRGMFPPNGPSYTIATKCSFKVGDESKIPAAISKIQSAMTPGEDRQLSEWLALLQAATAHRSGTEGSAAAGYAVYLSTLRQYPADVAKAACEKLARGKPGAGVNWFPTLAELIDTCDILAAPRKVMLVGLAAYTPPVTQQRHKPTSADRANVASDMAKFRAAMDAAKPPRPISAQLPPVQAKVGEGGVSAELLAMVRFEDEPE